MAANKRGTGLMAIEMSEKGGKPKGSNIMLNGECQVDMGDDTLPSSILSRFVTSSIEWKDGKKGNDGEALVHLGGDYDGYRIKVGYVKGKKNGEGLVIRGDGTPWLRVHYVNDVVEGEVLEYDEYNNVVMKGMMKNGKEVGLVRRYDKNGNEVSMSLFRDGNRVELKKSWIAGMYEERDRSGELVSISAMNMESMCKEGESYEYKHGILFRVCEYKNGEFIRVLKDIKDSMMTEFDENGNKVYEGEYDERIENGLKRKGKGKEYEKDGKTLVYVGDWSNGQRNGYGVLYKSSEAVYKGEWENGIPFGEGSFVKADGSVVEGKWEYGYLRVEDGKWLDYASGKVYEMKDKRRLPEWVKRGGEDVPSIREVMGGWYVIAPMFVLSVVYGCLIMAIRRCRWCYMFKDDNNGVWNWGCEWREVTLRWWGLTCPLWYVLFAYLICNWGRNGRIFDRRNKKEMRYFELNALLHALTMATLHLIPYTVGSWGVEWSDYMEYSIAEFSIAGVGLIMQLVVICCRKKESIHNMRYMCCHLVPLIGLFTMTTVSYDEFSPYWGIVMLINGIVSIIVAQSKRRYIRVCVIWDVFQLLYLTLWIISKIVMGTYEY